MENMPEFRIGSIFQPTIMLALALMAIIVMMILPMPAWVLDLGLAISFSLAILMFTVTLFIERPLDFSAFPTVLLASLMLRLSLNVSSTKLIIGEGHTGTDAAGDVIEGFAMFVMGGNAILGVVVFCVLLIVNFVVINKGATRMAEVGIEQAETTFFGSLDGASKFVKGDAIAGLLITALNLIVGLLIGIAMHDMPAAEAFKTYAILTVGDGLVSQIPAVVISIASALLLARGGAVGATDLALVDQLGRHPAAMMTVGVLMMLFALVPGLPFLPFMAGAIVLCGCAYALRRASLKKGNPEEVIEKDKVEAAPEKSMGDMLDLDDIHVEFAPNLVGMVLDPGTGLDARIVNMRSHVASEFGVLLPEIRLTDDASLQDDTYVVRVQGVEQARDRLRPGSILALLGDGDSIPLSGENVKEPVYGAPAQWISSDQQEFATMSGVTTVLPTEVLATHLLEIVKRNFARLMTHKALRRRLDEMINLTDRDRAEANRRMLDELIPDRLPIDVLLAVLRLLLEERVSIRNLPLIMEAAAEARQIHKTLEAITEHVRQRLGFQIVAELRRPDGTIPLIQLVPEWEETFVTYENLISSRMASPKS